MSMIAKSIGQRIRNYRTQAGLTQEKLAELSGLHPTYIGQVERGEKNTTLESILKISAAKQISITLLYETLSTDKASQKGIPHLCYELIAVKDKSEQERIYKILLEINKYKNN